MDKAPVLGDLCHWINWTRWKVQSLEINRLQKVLQWYVPQHMRASFAVRSTAACGARIRPNTPYRGRPSIFSKNDPPRNLPYRTKNCLTRRRGQRAQNQAPDTFPSSPTSLDMNTQPAMTDKPDTTSDELHQILKGLLHRLQDRKRPMPPSGDAVQRRHRRGHHLSRQNHWWTSHCRWLWTSTGKSRSKGKVRLQERNPMTLVISKQRVLALENRANWPASAIKAIRICRGDGLVRPVP